MSDAEQARRAIRQSLKCEYGLPSCQEPLWRRKTTLDLGRVLDAVRPPHEQLGT
jgi:hypothetical protein